MTVSEAKELLDEYHPDLGKSCIDRKRINDEYDLEIIIPAYNVEEYIEQCIESVIYQKTDYKFHVTCVDDGSSDNTGKLLDKYKESNMDIIHQKNSGVSAARNTALRKSKGKYIMFVDSDDYLPENAIQVLLKTAFSNDADIVEGGYYACEGKGNISNTYSFQNGKIDSTSDLKGMPWGKVYKKYLFEDISFPEGYWYEDSVLRHLIYPVVDKVYGVADPVYYYRNNMMSITRSGKKKKKALDSLWVTLKLYEDRKKIGLVTDQDYYEYILRMTKLSYLRTKFQPAEIIKAEFVMFSEFINQEFKEFSTEKYSDLEYSLKTKRYELFRRYCDI